jgi:DNA-binding MarR family transcriptional regulator
MLTPEETAHRLPELFAVVGPLYRRAQRAVERDEHHEGVSVGVRAVLEMLRAHGPLTVPDMGRTQSLSRQFVQRMVNDALAEGLVETRENPRHRRSRLVALTPRGTTTMNRIAARERAVLTSLGARYSDTDLDTCVRVLGDLVQRLDEVD